MDLLIIDDRIVIAGPDSEPYPVDDGDDRGYVGLRLAPGRLPGLLGLKAAELRNTRVPLADVLGAGPARLIRETSELAGSSFGRLAR